METWERICPGNFAGSDRDPGGLWKEGEVAGNEVVSHRNQLMQGPPSSVLGFSSRNRGKEWNRCTFTQPDPWFLHQSLSHKHGERVSKQSSGNSWPFYGQVVYLLSGRSSSLPEFHPQCHTKGSGRVGSLVLHTQQVSPGFLISKISKNL